MGTHPIFESDFDCLTEVSDLIKKCKTTKEKVLIYTSHESAQLQTVLSALRINLLSNSTSLMSTQQPVACLAQARPLLSAVPSDAWVNPTTLSTASPENVVLQNNFICCSYFVNNKLRIY